MIEICKAQLGKFSALWAATLAMLALISTPVLPGAGAAWGQTPTQERRTSPLPIAAPQIREPTRVFQEKQRVKRNSESSAVGLSAREPTRVVQDRSAVQGKSQPTPVALPVRESTGGALGTALASCEKEAENSEALTLPGARGEVKLDRCYRGRDHLVCSFNTLLKEASSLIEDYGRIIDAHYPEVSNVSGICVIKHDNLATDLQKANEFANRYKTLKVEYDARSKCATKIGQSLKDVTLPDMAQAPEILKSMIDSLEGDLKDVSVVQAKVVELADRIQLSQKAITTIQKIHRIICVKDQRTVSQTEDRAAR